MDEVDISTEISLNPPRRTVDEADISNKISLNPLDETVCLDGEDLTDFCSYPRSAWRQNHVFWDLVKYPIPPGAKLETSIRAALNKMGLYSCETIVAYGDRMSHSEDDLRNSSILHKPQGELAVDLLYAADPRSPLNIMVIPRPDTKSELHRVLKGLQSRHHNILIVNPKAHDGPFLFDSGESIVECTEDLDGGKPIIGGRRMGDKTPVIKDLRSLVSLFESVSKAPGRRTAFVFWDLARYITPTESTVIPIGTGIRAALQRLGHHGCVEILAFGADILTLRRDSDSYKEARIIRLPHGLYKNAWQLFLRLKPGPLMIIPTIDPSCLRFSGPDWSFNSLLRKPGHYDLLFVTPPPVDEATPKDVKFRHISEDAEFLHKAHLILGCTHGVYEGKKITRGRRDMKDIQDFSKPITFKKGATEGQFVFVFWNLEDFPFPTGLTPDAIYEKIESVFLAFNYELRNLSIWAYIDDKEGSWGGDFLSKKIWSSSIYFLPVGGDKSARRNRMLHDILLWSKDVEPFPPHLVIVSNEDKIMADKKFSSTLELLSHMNINVIIETGSSFFEV
ncbi:unnamed protein product [Microthlaspi erraticum]|uniref:NYN domain-containing protein n=1 Tax=Microthlaspi erraticum TaxID=1685480 RepID=A0A6D2L683_9BRAS|nr:unnamed protein product [Microthlaspi erraticum]